MQYFADDEDFDEQARQQTAELRREIARRLDDIRGNNTMRKPASAAQAIDAMCQRWSTASATIASPPVERMQEAGIEMGEHATPLKLRTSTSTSLTKKRTRGGSCSGQG